MTWPANGSDSEKENIPRRTKKKGGRKNKTKLQDSFALMHGFTATNVGKGRITVCGWWPCNVGILSKDLIATASPPERWCFQKREGIAFFENGQINYKKSKQVSIYLLDMKIDVYLR